MSCVYSVQDDLTNSVVTFVPCAARRLPHPDSIRPGEIGVYREDLYVDKKILEKVNKKNTDMEAGKSKVLKTILRVQGGSFKGSDQ